MVAHKLGTAGWARKPGQRAVAGSGRPSRSVRAGSKCPGHRDTGDGMRGRTLVIAIGALVTGPALGGDQLAPAASAAPGAQALMETMHRKQVAR